MIENLFYNRLVSHQKVQKHPLTRFEVSLTPLNYLEVIQIDFMNIKKIKFFWDLTDLFQVMSLAA